MNRNQITLAGLLVLQVALILLVRSPFSSGTQAAESRPLLPMLEAVTPTQIELLGDEDRRVQLVKQADGWQLENLDGFPADDTKIDSLIDDLRALTIRRPLVTSQRYHATFKVAGDENEGRVKVWDNPVEDPAAELILGSSSNYRAVHVRLAGQDDVYEVRGLATYSVRPDAEAWIEKDLVDVPETQLVSLALHNANGSLELLHEQNQWRASGTEEALDASEVSTLVRAAGSIQLSKPVGRKDEAAHGFADPAATLILRYRALDDPAAEPAEIVVQLGSKPTDDGSERYITRSDFAFTGLVWDSTVKTLLEQKLEDLLGGDDDTTESG